MMSISDLDREISDAGFMAGRYHRNSGKQSGFWVRECRRLIRRKVSAMQAAAGPVPKCPAAKLKEDCVRGCALGQWCPKMPRPY